MPQSAWKSHLLIAAAIHCCLWGVFVMALPKLSFRVYGYTDPLVNTLVWQGCGFVIFLFGAAYGFAATDVHRHYGLVLMGTAAKTVGTVGVAYGFVIGELVWHSLLWITLNDLIWIVPFSLMIRDAIREDHRRNSLSDRRGIWFDWMQA